MWSYNYYTNTLQHHGIRGQRWGKRNGPPYPLGAQTRKMIRRAASETYRSVGSMTVGEIKTAHRSNVEKIRSGKGSQKEINSLLKKEDTRYKKALLDKEQMDKEKYQNISQDCGKKIAKKVLITAGVITVASIAAYGIYKYRKQLGEKTVKDFLDENGARQVKDFLDPSTGKNLNYLGKSQWISEQVSKGLIGQARTFKNGYEANQYNTKNLFDKKEWKSLTFSERLSVKSYTGSFYRNMNTALREGTLDSASKTTQSFVEHCTSALEKSSLKEDVFVHRGVKAESLSKMLGVDPEMLKNPTLLEQLRGSRFVEKGFFSSAGSEDDAWSGVKLHVFAPKGTKGMYVNPISKYKGEHEFLLQRNTRFEILDFQTDELGNITNLMLTVLEQILD